MRRSRESRPATGSRYWLVGGFVALVCAALTVAWKFALQVLTPSARIESGVEVVALVPAAGSPTGTRVWLRGPDIALPGNYSFIFGVTQRSQQHLAGHARLGPVVQREGSGRQLRVARDVQSVEQGELRVGARGRITGWWYTDPSQLGYASRRVAIPMRGGVSWGWVISPPNAVPGRWAIHVHGRGALPLETLRGIEPFAEAGITSLVIAYRNDPGAPPGIGGKYGLGLSEQEDVEAAIGWARLQGADRVTLVGWSMGATAVVLAASRERHAGLVDGMVLDSPALDWPGLLRHQAKLARVPLAVAELGMWMLRLGWTRGSFTDRRGTDISALTPERLSSVIHVPTLIHAGAGDTFVPWKGALRVARLRSSLVQLHPSPGEHVKLWNADPIAWNRETARFLRTLSSDAINRPTS